MSSRKAYCWFWSNKLALRGQLAPSYVKDGIELAKPRANVVT